MWSLKFRPSGFFGFSDSEKPRISRQALVSPVMSPTTIAAIITHAPQPSFVCASRASQISTSGGVTSEKPICPTNEIARAITELLEQPE